MSRFFSPQGHGVQLWSYLDELKQKLKPKPKRKTPTESTVLPASLTEIKSNKSKTALGFKERDNLISGFAADFWCLFYHFKKKSYLLYSHIALFFLKDSGETGQRMKFSIYPQSRLNKKK